MPSWVKFKSVLMSAFLSTLLLFIAVGFFTLLERKVLALLILRVGPAKPSLCGLLVPFADALKLLAKPFIIPLSGSKGLMYFSCLLGLLVPSCLWLFVSLPSASWWCSFTVLSILV